MLPFHFFHQSYLIPNFLRYLRRNHIKRFTLNLDPKRSVFHFMFPTIIPFCHLWSKRSWLSNDQWPPRRTLDISNSDWNLNWNRFSPTSVICILSSKPYALFKVILAALLLKGLHVRNFPVRLKLQLSMASNRPSSEMGITSSSSDVNFIFPKLSITSSAIIT